jgi:hypothetical protein
MPFTGGDFIMPNDLTTQAEPESAKLAVPLLERMDPAIGETTSVLGAIMTEFLRRTLRGGVLQIGKELHTFVDEKVDAAIVDRSPALERTAAEVAEHAARSAATEIAHEEVRALESRTRDATQETANSLANRIEEAKKQAQDAVFQTANGLVTQIKEAAKRVGEAAHAEVTQKVEDLHERSRQSYAQVHERLDALGKMEQTLAKQLQEQQNHRKAENQALKTEIQKLTNQLRLVNDRLAELEKPRGLRAWLGRLFGRKPKTPENSVVEKTSEATPKKTPS